MRGVTQETRSPVCVDLTGCRIRVHFGAADSEEHRVEDGIYLGFAKHKLHSFGIGANWHTIDLGAHRGGAQPMQLAKLPQWSLLDGGQPVDNPLSLPKYKELVKVTPSEGRKLLKKFVHHCYGKTVMKQHDSGFEKEQPTYEAQKSGAGQRISIDLYKCRVNNLRCSQLASMMSLCCSVVSIRLSYNNIGDDGAVSLATALPCCTQIEQIHLPLNAIGDTGAAALAQALAELPALHTLSLRSNDIGGAGVDAFAQHLASVHHEDADRPLTKLRYEARSHSPTFALI